MNLDKQERMTFGIMLLTPVIGLIFAAHMKQPITLLAWPIAAMTVVGVGFIVRSMPPTWRDWVLKYLLNK